jgi:hypothetical protein
MQLDNKFKSILEYLENPASHHHTGDKLVCYLTFDTDQNLEVKQKLASWLSLAKGFGFSCSNLSMTTVINKFFQNNPRRSKWLVPDTEDGPEAVSDFFKDDLGSMIVENQVIEKAVLQAQENLFSEAKPLLIVTDLEAIHPFTRFGPVEQNIYSDIKIPLIILYPGTISGSSLEFLGFYPQDGNYRSKHF